MQIYEELVARGLIAQVTNEEEIREMINNEKQQRRYSSLDDQQRQGDLLYRL